MDLPVLRPVPVEATGLLLRPWTEADAPALLHAATDPLVAKWNPLPPTPPGQRPLAVAEAWCPSNWSIY